ncbi:alpha-ketoglutarate-dependent dioxygenase alkB homolog 4 isoform X2 [Protopterus annectens]|uniref:alpha-ketoglutarate-dependent dioxygenase alkB homolog 4 isoform X2 n=1 Tax=Protopterus annectens TaxID=7888 RepID=UPI001CF9578B|nr:alpha-ketoglutarate-dependent dioxygenase alkB homolog 4 isoform X2 [Protopterus annectens]
MDMAPKHDLRPLCGCKGIRSCLLCEAQNSIERPEFKKDYGPKVNFKKQKVRIGNYSGLPSFSQKLFDRMKKYMILEDFLPVEQCNLDYNPERGSAIVPHFDDSWLWGERLVSVNLLSETVLTMSSDSENTLPLFPVCDPNEINSAVQKCTDKCLGDEREGVSNRLSFRDVDVAIHLPRCSLVVLYGQARYDWKHAIHREHIGSRRICSTFRELSAEFSSSGKLETLGKELRDIALQFQGAPV